jgi:PAS domain S-box-containing protein
MTSEPARSEARLRETERMLGVGSWELSLETDEITFSPGFARLLGLPDGAALDTAGHRQRVDPADRGILSRARATCLSAGSATCEYRVFRPDGEVRTLSLRAEACPEEDGITRNLRGAVLDVTEQREAERGRPAAEQPFEQGFDAALIGMALSDPVHGHCVRVNDALCRLLQRSRAQLSGAELNSFAHPDDQAGVRHAHQQMLGEQTAAVQAETRYLLADGSVVWALLHVTPVHRPDGSIEALYSQVVDVTERKEHEARLEVNVGDALWLARIRDALDESRLLLYTQPIVDLVTGQTVQNELLLRMRGDDGSIISPGEFLPVAERYGLISEIDRWVIGRAVEIAAGGTPTEFNLSGRSIGDPSILRELATAIQTTGADPSLLVVEVTETALLSSTEGGREFANRVTELGCGLALDDFGTGFSSLRYLKHLPADYLKVDIEFVRDLAGSETDARVVRGIVGLAREFRQTTIAEGVEDEATLLRLKELGVDQAQGYLLGRPAPLVDAAPAPAARRRTASSGGPDPIAVVRGVFEAFASRDLPTILRLSRPDVVLRTFATSGLADRRAPYRGHDGLRTYIDDVDALWDELALTPLTFRQAQDSVIAFGRAEGRRGASRVLASVLWVARLQRGQISSIEVFQAASGPSLSQRQMDRLRDSVVAASV